MNFKLLWLNLHIEKNLQHYPSTSHLKPPDCSGMTGAFTLKNKQVKSLFPGRTKVSGELPRPHMFHTLGTPL